MKFTTLIPTTLNDGTPVDPAVIDATIQGWAIQFGGATVEGTCVGHWIDTADGRHYQDTTIRVSVVCGNDEYAAAVEAVEAMGRMLGQKAVYFEVRDFDGVQFRRLE